MDDKINIINDIKPINTPKGWNSKKEFIDDDGNVFNKGKFSHTINELIVENNYKIVKEHEVLNEYVSNNIPFRIYSKDELLFDTKNKLRKEYPIFNENDFIILNKIYIYRGIRIERY